MLQGWLLGLAQYLWLYVITLWPLSQSHQMMSETSAHTQQGDRFMKLDLISRPPTNPAEQIP